MASNFDTTIEVLARAKPACVLVMKNIQIFKITKAIEWFFNRMCDGNMAVYNVFGVWIHNQIVSVGLQSAIVRSIGDRSSSETPILISLSNANERP